MGLARMHGPEMVQRTEVSAGGDRERDDWAADSMGWDGAVAA